jgi:uncharacterized protein (DUF3084 family)
MPFRYVLPVVAGLVLAFAVSAPALAQERPVAEATRGGAELCERLASKAQALQAEISRIEAVQGRIDQRIASGELRPRQVARAKLALRLLEARQDALEELLARVLHAYEQRCE